MSRRRISREQRTVVYARSGGRCEAVTTVGGRCDLRARQVHHRVRQGGDALDRAGETRHLAHLCPRHHRAADGYDGTGIRGVLLDGEVVAAVAGGSARWDKLLGRPVYHGTDPIFSAAYPPHVVSRAQA